MTIYSCSAVVDCVAEVVSLWPFEARAADECRRLAADLPAGEYGIGYRVYRWRVGTGEAPVAVGKIYGLEAPDPEAVAADVWDGIPF